MRIANLLIKRLIDFFGSLVGIIVISPIFILIALSIKFTSKGPVFFKQERIGKDGKAFNILKFRTMIVNAESMGDGVMIKSESDSRITKAGKMLRKSSLDELPQLWNVLVGEMSLVGPRPPVTYHPYDGYENYPDWGQRRFTMRPGITGLAQITVRNSVSWDERMRLDIQYVDKFNIWLDIKILLLTIIKVIKKESIYDKFDTDILEEATNE